MLTARALRRLHKHYPARRAAITGAGAGLGEALALELGRHGWTLFLNDLDEARLGAVAKAATAEGGTVHAYSFDAASREETTRAATAFLAENGGVDVVVTAAGIGVGGAFLDTPPEHLREVVDVNLLGTAWTARAFLPAMVAAGRGHLVTVASAAAFHGLPHLSAYAATKAGVVALSETLRSELRSKGVDVTCKMTTFYSSTIAEHTRGSDEEREKARSLVGMAPWSAAEVADALLLSVQARRFYMVAPRQARLLWRFKRLLPDTYLSLMPRLFPKLEAKLLAKAAERGGA